ncbi:MAG: PA0069 family radical SAM protein [Planctomycetota bacterium]
MRFGSSIDPPNRFERAHREDDFEHLDEDDIADVQGLPVHVEYYADQSKSIVTENQSPDIPFRYSLNPYRGCLHGCSYCYARVSHEFLGLNSGIDFETKIIVKEDAPQLFRQFLSRPKWKPEPIVFSGVTDCYQPAEARYQLTRQCLEVALKFRQPVSVITKNALLIRDLGLLSELADQNLLHVHLSITTLDTELGRAMEPKTSTPAARMAAVEKIADAGIPVGIMMAPIVPGLTDSEIPAILETAKNAGAQSANYIMLRLPLNVETVFLDWLARERPSHAEKVESLIRQMREGKTNNSKWGQRMTGTGVFADQIRNMFAVFCTKFGLARRLERQDCSRFQIHEEQNGQLRLF